MHRRSHRSSLRARALAVLAAFGVIALVAACSSAQAANRAEWTPARTVAPIPLPTEVPPGGGAGNSAPPSSGGGSSNPSQPPSGGSSSSAATDPSVVATKLAAPVGIAVLPDTSALVGERTTGRIVQVQPVAGLPVKTIRTLTGLDTSGGGGLLDLALSATYAEDGIVLALITTRTDVRVVHFTLTGPATPILTGIPKGATHNIGRLLVLGNGTILVGTGDAGNPALAANPNSLAGKILRIDDVGQPAAGNPSAGSPVYASGFTTVDGMCVDTSSSRIYATQAGSVDKLNVITAGKTYTAADGQSLSSDINGVGGCAVINKSIFVSALGGKDIFYAALGTDGQAGSLTGALKGKYGRIKNVVPAADGTVWATTSNRDGSGTPVATDERVLHLRLSGGGGGSTV